MIQLVQKSFAFLIQRNEESQLFKVFLHVPGVTEKDCVDFVAGFKERKSVKGQRHSTKIFLQECAKALSTSSSLTEDNPLFSGDKATILDLPAAPLPKHASQGKGMEWFQERYASALLKHYQQSFSNKTLELKQRWESTPCLTSRRSQ